MIVSSGRLLFRLQFCCTSSLRNGQGHLYSDMNANEKFKGTPTRTRNEMHEANKHMDPSKINLRDRLHKRTNKNEPIKNKPQAVGNVQPMDESGTENTAPCICARISSYVFCRSCAFSCKGRVRRPCPAHPKVTYLHDIPQCPECKASTRYLIEVD